MSEHEPPTPPAEPPKDNVAYLGAHANNSKMLSVSGALRACADEIDSGKVSCSRVLIICVDDSRNNFDIALRLGNANHALAVAMCAYAMDIVISIGKRP